MKRALYLLCLLILAIGYTHAQQEPADSLIRHIQSMPDDTAKVNQYYNAGKNLIYQNPLQAIPFFKAGAVLAKKLEFDSGAERCFNGVSLSFSMNGKYDSALVYNATSLGLAHKTNDIARLAQAYLNRADIHANLQQLAAALKDCRTALKYAEKLGNKNGLGRIYSIMSDIYSWQEQYQPALQYLEKAQTYFEQSGNRQMLGMCYSDRADLLQQAKELDKAAYYKQKAIHMADSVGDTQNLSGYYGGLAQIYFEQKKFKQARQAADSTLHYTLQTGHKKHESLVYDLYYHFDMENKAYAQAIAHALKGYDIMKAEKDLVREHAFANNLAEAYYAFGNAGKAYEYQAISRQLNDSLQRQRYDAETARLEATLRTAEKDKEIQLLNKDKELHQQHLKQQQLLTLGAFILVFLALSAIALLVNRYRLGQRMKELELRNRIAADLHDEVGSSLNSIYLLSQVATQEQNTAQAHLLERMSTNARETMERMGDIVWMIKPGEHEEQSLIERMERFAYELCSCRNVGYSLTGTENLQKLKLNMQQRKNFYLVFKEALNNAVKYSGSNQIDILIAKAEQQLSLTIEDHGQGFDTASSGIGNGLDNMKNRARELGGNLSVDSEIGRGTSIKLAFAL